MKTAWKYVTGILGGAVVIVTTILGVPEIAGLTKGIESAVEFNEVTEDLPGTLESLSKGQIPKTNSPSIENRNLQVEKPNLNKNQTQTRQKKQGIEEYLLQGDELNNLILAHHPNHSNPWVFKDRKKILYKDLPRDKVLMRGFSNGEITGYLRADYTSQIHPKKASLIIEVTEFSSREKLLERIKGFFIFRKENKSTTYQCFYNGNTIVAIDRGNFYYGWGKNNLEIPLSKREKILAIETLQKYRKRTGLKIMTLDKNLRENYKEILIQKKREILNSKP